MGNLEDVRRDKWWQVWFTWYGRNRILPYDKEKGAGYYLTKYIVKEESDLAVFTIKGLEYVNQLILDLSK